MTTYWEYPTINTVDHIDEIKFRDKFFSIYRMKNLKFKFNDSEKFIKIPGKSFILPFHRFIWHYFQEYIGQYELINDIISDVNPIFLDEAFTGYPTFDDFLPNVPDYAPFFTESFNLYAKDRMIYGIDKNIEFEEVYVILDASRIFKRELFEDFGLVPYWFPHQNWIDLRHYYYMNIWQLMSYPLMKKRFLQITKDDAGSPSKIYISRADANKRHKERWGEEDPYNLVKNRTYDAEPIIEKFFTDIGYKSVSFEHMTYPEQLTILKNATHVAGISGSGFINTFICNPGTSIIELFVKPNDSFAYRYMADLMDLKYHLVDVREYNFVNAPIETLDEDKIFEKLNKFKDIY